MHKVAICITSYNSAQFLKTCVESILRQNYQGFSLIIIDDGSTDGTENIISNIHDKRIYYKKNAVNAGIAFSRNKCLEMLNDEKYIFFTDADCVVETNWLENGVKVFHDDRNAVCVIGKTEYVHAGYKPHMFENSHIQTDNWGEAYQTCNIAYLTSAVKEIGGFDAKNFNHMNEDIDLAIRIKEKFPDKKFIRNREMKVIHHKIEWTISNFFRDARKAIYFVKLLKKHGKYNRNLPLINRGMILNKNQLLLFLFPPGIVFYILQTNKRVNSIKDIVYIFLTIIKCYYYRLLVWRSAIKERILLI